MWKGKFPDLLRTFTQFFEDHIVPNESKYYDEVEHNRKTGNPWRPVRISEELAAQAKALGLWNLFLPDVSGLSQYEYAQIAEIMGRVPCFVDVFNCDAPDTGNMEVLHAYGTPAQQRQWLDPLLEGTIRSAFCMTEPGVASSDATNIRCEAALVRGGGGGGPDTDMWAITGTKWWSTGAGSPKCRLLIVMAYTGDLVGDNDGHSGAAGRGGAEEKSPQSQANKKMKKTSKSHSQHTMLLVPVDTPGVQLVRPLHVFGQDDAPKGHFEVRFDRVMVPVATSTLLGAGRGFEIAQGRLGPGRVHHCMRSIGMAERALELMVDRSLQRKTFGKHLAAHGVVQQQIAQSRLEIDQVRLLVLNCASLLDEARRHHAHSPRDDKGSAGEGGGQNHHNPTTSSTANLSVELKQRIAMIKIVAPRVACLVIDRSIQVHGAKGLSQDSVLWKLYAGQRSLRIADGPDEVHERTVCALEIRRQVRSGKAKL